MNRLIKLVRSDLFLSLVGGFALGVAGMAVIKPAAAGSEMDSARSVTVGAPLHAENSPNK
jgi:hypothetical protein